MGGGEGGVEKKMKRKRLLLDLSGGMGVRKKIVFCQGLMRTSKTWTNLLTAFWLHGKNSQEIGVISR